MARSTDRKKLALWQGRFQRFVRSGLSVVRFCAAEDVSESSFYYWQKKLEPTTLRRRARAEDLGDDRGASAEDRGVCSEGRRASATGRGVFRPVTVVPTTSGVVVRLPSGTRIEADAAHLDVIRAVVAETVHAEHGRATQPSVPAANHLIGQRGGTVSC